MGLFSTPAPRWLTIPAHRPFVDDLARGLWESLGAQSPEALASCLEEAFKLDPAAMDAYRGGARSRVERYRPATISHTIGEQVLPVLLGRR